MEGLGQRPGTEGGREAGRGREKRTRSLPLDETVWARGGILLPSLPLDDDLFSRLAEFRARLGAQLGTNTVPRWYE